ncbi:MAG: WecB/TagA/CpsF family glycosyltransferase [Bacillaceae bacterium]|nr:WecB/TagA/CpsF family glycosyltransferase [Bacillaceae bacterium]
MQQDSKTSLKKSKPSTHIFNILDIPFSIMPFTQTVNWITSRVNDKTKQYKSFIITANPEIVMLAQSNPELQQAIQKADLITPDGIGIVIASRLLKKQNNGQVIPERVAGYDLLHGIMKQADQNHWKVYLLGASPDSNQGAADKLKTLYPNAQIVGHRDGYFTQEDEPEIIRDINDKQPHILFVALGAPKQEIWISKLLDRLNVNLAMAVGGSFDVLSGKAKRAPVIWQKLYMEWFYRLLSEPRRWRRQLALPRFMLDVIKKRVLSRQTTKK